MARYYVLAIRRGLERIGFEVQEQTWSELGRRALSSRALFFKPLNKGSTVFAKSFGVRGVEGLREPRALDGFCLARSGFCSVSDTTMGNSAQHRAKSPHIAAWSVRAAIWRGVYCPSGAMFASALKSSKVPVTVICAPFCGRNSQAHLCVAAFGAPLIHLDTPFNKSQSDSPKPKPSMLACNGVCPSASAFMSARALSLQSRCAFTGTCKVWQGLEVTGLRGARVS